MNSHYSILLVDDEEIILATVGRDLQKEGFDVTLCNSGVEAIKLLQEINYDVVLTDLMMEGVGGLDVLKKAREVNPDMMVMVITGFGSLSSAIEALRLGAVDYLLKPCNRAELSMRVNNCIEKIELRKVIKAYESVLPVCSVCSRIRDDEGKKAGSGDWLTINDFLKKRAHNIHAHGYCPSCTKKINTDIDDFLTHDIDIKLEDFDPPPPN